MSLEFLTPSAPGGNGPAPVARSPMEGAARAAGARFEIRDGWSIAVEFPGRASGPVAWTDTSHLSKLELQGDGGALEAAAGTPLSSGTAVRQDGAWWCRLTSSRALVIGARPALDGADGLDVLDVTSNFASLTVTGPQARETLARFCALDLRPEVTPVSALRPGSIARQPGILIREGEDRYLTLFGWATGEYLWSVVADAGTHLGGGPLGLAALAAVDAPEAARA